MCMCHHPGTTVVSSSELFTPCVQLLAGLWQLLYTSPGLKKLLILMGAASVHINQATITERLDASELVPAGPCMIAVIEYAS